MAPDQIYEAFRRFGTSVPRDAAEWIRRSDLPGILHDTAAGRISASKHIEWIVVTAASGLTVDEFSRRFLGRGV